jgi:hypothetical protein
MCLALLPDLCGKEDVTPSTAPGGRAEARTFLWNCGATTGYVFVATLTVKGLVWDHEREIYRSDLGGMPRLRWAAPDRLIVDCTQCAGSGADLTFHGVVVTYIKPNGALETSQPEAGGAR